MSAAKPIRGVVNNAKFKDPADVALQNGPYLETASTDEGDLITRRSPPGTPTPLHKEAHANGVSGDANQKQGDNLSVPAARPAGRVRANSFSARPSLMDWETLQESQNSFRGFFTLVWMTMAAYMSLNLFNNWKNDGQFIGTHLATQMFSESWDFLFSEIVLIMSLFSVFFFTKFLVSIRSVFAKGSLTPRVVARAIQHTYQTIWFGIALYWVYNRDNWSWTQKGSFTIHTMAMLLKQHSYMSYNAEMLHKWTKVQQYKRRMDELAGSMKKLNDASSELAPSNKEWEECKEKAQETQVELRKGNTEFPKNVTFYNFIDYLLVPTLVYELEYPRTNRIRPWYVFEKTAGFLGVCMCLYITIEHLIYPVLMNMGSITFVESLTQLLIPFMVAYMMIFYLIFECVLCWFAEMTRFADRQFYDDWWNSVTFDEYARKWNKPVHEFLLRHVYLESISQYKLSKNNATFLTFFLSSCLHEVVMVVLSKRLRMYLFIMQMLQIPLIYVSRWSKLKKHPRWGNGFFWFAMYTGPPLLGIAYCREVFV